MGGPAHPQTTWRVQEWPKGSGWGREEPLVLGRWGNSEGQLLDCDVLEPLSSCHPKLFLLCLSPLQVMAPPQPSLKGRSQDHHFH